MAAERPPLGTRLKYYLLGLTPPVQYRGWVVDDVSSRAWPLRYALQMTLALAGAAFVVSVIGSQLDAWPWLASVSVAVVFSVVLFGSPRKRTLRYYEMRWTKQEPEGESGITGPASPG